MPKHQHDGAQAQAGAVDASFTARLGDEEWELFCGNCDAFLAECVWVDIHLAMLMNATQAETGIALPPQERRRYRMAVRLSRDEWQAMENEAWWQCSVPPERRRSIPRRSRIAEGYWNTAQMGHQVIPPTRLQCPSCGTMQEVGRMRRRGVPPL